MYTKKIKRALLNFILKRIFSKSIRKYTENKYIFLCQFTFIFVKTQISSFKNNANFIKFVINYLKE